MVKMTNQIQENWSRQTELFSRQLTRSFAEEILVFVSRSSEIRYSLLIGGLYISKNRIPSITVEQPQSNRDVNVVDLLGSQPNAAVPPCTPKLLSERKIWAGVLMEKTTELVWLSNHVSVTNMWLQVLNKNLLRTFSRLSSGRRPWEFR